MPYSPKAKRFLGMCSNPKGRAKAKGLPYCKDHARIAYVAPEAKHRGKGALVRARVPLLLGLAKGSMDMTKKLEGWDELNTV